MPETTIAAVRCWRIGIPYRKPFIIAGGPSAVADHVIVALETRSGLIGVGEGAPMASYSDETPDDCQSAIENCLAPQVVGLDALDFEILHATLDKSIAGHSFAKAAIDLAAYDLAGKALGLPVHRLLGGPVRRRVPLAWAVGLGTTQEMVDEAVAFVRRGFETIKLKIGRDPKLDLQNVAAVRDAIGPQVALRVDANQGYTVDVAIPTLRRMEAYDLQLIEQPVPRWDLAGMARIAAALDTPILADEAVFDAHDAWQVIRHQAADIINIKIMKPGGLYRSKQVAAVAAAAGLPCLVGSMIEMGPGTAAGLHFAASTPNVQYPSELIGPVMLTGDVIRENSFAPEQVPGYLEVGDAPGLGVTLFDDSGRYRPWEGAA